MHHVRPHLALATPAFLVRDETAGDVAARERLLDAAFGPANIIWAVEHGHQAAISVHQYCQGLPVTERPPQGMTLSSTKMGLHEWAYSNNYSAEQRAKMKHVDMPARFSGMTIEVEEGFSDPQTRAEVQRCLAAGERESPLHTWADSLAIAGTLDAILDAVGVAYPFP